MSTKAKTISYPVINAKGESVGTMRLDREIFGIEPHLEAMHRAVNVYLANSREVIAKTKDRSEVRGGGRKPWRQKGTGRARHGSRRSPIWVGGGVTFGPTGKENFKISMNRKEYALALRSALSAKVAEKAFIVIDDLLEIEPKTKAAVSFLNAIDATGKVLIISDDNAELSLAVRNLKRVQKVGQAKINVYDLLNADKVVIEKATLVALEGGLK